MSFADLAYDTADVALPAGWRGVVLLTTMWVGGIAIVLGRIPRASWNVLWAEDGIVFLRDAWTHGLTAMVQPYAGYLHIVPRFLAELAVLFPPSIEPTAVTLLAAATASALGVSVFMTVGARVRRFPLRISVWLAAFALPVMGGEALGTIANLHWFLLIAAFCAAVSRARTASAAAVQGIVLCAAVLSDPLAALLIPLLAVRWWLIRDRRETVIAVAFLAATAVQAIGTVSGTLLAGDRSVSASRPSGFEFLEMFGYRAAATSILGIHGSSAAARTVDGALPWLALAAVAVIVVAGATLSRRLRVVICGFSASAIAFAAIVWALQWEFITSGGLARLDLGDRYTIVPTALVTIAILLAIDGISHRLSGTTSLVVSVAALAVVVALVLIDARVWMFRDGTPSWTDQLAARAEDCPSDAASSVRVQIAPATMGLFVDVPCEIARQVSAPGRRP